MEQGNASSPVVDEETLRAAASSPVVDETLRAAASSPVVDETKKPWNASSSDVDEVTPVPPSFTKEESERPSQFHPPGTKTRGFIPPVMKTNDKSAISASSSISNKAPSSNNRVVSKKAASIMASSSSAPLAAAPPGGGAAQSSGQTRNALPAWKVSSAAANMDWKDVDGFEEIGLRVKIWKAKVPKSQTWAFVPLIASALGALHGFPFKTVDEARGNYSNGKGAATGKKGGKRSGPNHNFASPNQIQQAQQFWRNTFSHWDKWVEPTTPPDT